MTAVVSETLPLLPHGEIRLPAFLPDATRAVVRSVDAVDLEEAGVQAVVMNVFHVMRTPGSSTVAALGGLHRMSGWPRPIVTDSGGFQAYSLIRQNPRSGAIGDRGISFQPDGAERKFHLSPEKSIQLQLAYGADIVICLDDCTHVDDAAADQRLSVTRTIAWARRCKEEFTRRTEHHSSDDPVRRRLFGVVQGGGDYELRRECAEALLEIGFDGFGYGGWPLDGQGHLLVEMLAHTRALIPRSMPMHALGIGQPGHVLTCARLGYALFDSALPTRDARAGRLYAFTSDPHDTRFQLAGDWYAQLYIEDKKHIKANRPISPGCDCHTCRRYSVGYLHHLHKIGDTLYARLATIHNLRFMMQLMDLIRGETHAG